MKLNLGCYNKKMYGFVNVDIREEVKPDVVDDIFELKAFKNQSASLIYASHVLEHLTRKDALQSLKRWFEVLEFDGTLRIAVPNIEEACKHYIYHRDLKVLSTMFWGSGCHDYDYHKTGWDFDTLKADLLNSGYENVEIFDPWKTEHYYIDDYSKSYLPTCNIEFKNGHATPLNRCMSLNVECKKPSYNGPNSI